MTEDYFIIHKSILPDYFESVLKAKSYVDNEQMSVCEACKLLDISRSTFYKYKDNIFLPPKSYGKKAIVAIKASDKIGVLSGVLSVIHKLGANIITINQDMPIKDCAYITIAIDISSIESDLNELIKQLKQIKHVHSANILGVD